MSRHIRKDVNIVGYSLRLPESDNAHDFHTNLLNKINMVTKDDRRWPPGYYDTPEYFGKLKQSLDYFDNVFFSIHGKQAEKLDPQLRLLLETSFEALIDAAILPEEIKGIGGGVYLGAPFTDAHRYLIADKDNMTGYEHTGCANSMFANRLAFFYDLHGPSYNLDNACASSLTALHQAYQDIQNGRCDFALVGGSSILINSSMTVGFNKLKMLAADGLCKTFDKDANGYTRAEGVVVIILTSQPKFVRYAPYAKILATATNTCGYNENGISFPSSKWQSELYKEIINETKTDSNEIKYIECHGTGTVAGDTEEITGIKIFFGDRKDLILGSAKSNMGHAEGASGLANLAKVLLSYETKIIYPQLHLKNKLPILGNLKVLTEAKKWQGSKTIVNSFGFGGSNACVLLENLSVKEKLQKNWHQLYFISARTKDGLYALKRELEHAPQQLPAWLDQRFPWREVVGVADDAQLEKISEERPIYFFLSGNGSQWKGMGINLMRTSPLFKTILLQCGKDIPSLLIKGWSSASQATCLLTAIQIGLIELLRSFGIKEAGYIGYSAGEIAASYASGATTIAETMAIAKARGKEADRMPEGLMASVGLSKKQAMQYLKGSDKVWLACINSPRNITISGDKTQVQAIIQKLLAEEIFVRELDTSGKPYHSKFINAEKVSTALKKAYPGSVARNKNWISAISDFDPEMHNADYQIQSVIRPVDFLNAMKKIPENAIAVEIGPHTSLRSLIRDCASSVKYIPLMLKDTDDLESFKQGIAKLWTLGAKLNIIPDRVRPSLSIRAKQVAWQRDYFPIPRDDYQERKFKRNFIFDLKGKDNYLLAHVIDGKAIFPATGYIYLMWQCYLKDHPESKIVTLDNFKILRSVPLIGDTILLVVSSGISGEYELSFNNELIAKAKLDQKESSAAETSFPDFKNEHSVNSETFYRLCANDGYEYEPAFQAVKNVFVPNHSGILYAQVEFKEWISFLDGLLQVWLLRKKYSGLRLPTAIRHIELSNNKAEYAVLNSYINSIQCGEILIQGLETTPAVRKRKDEKIIFQKQDYLKLGHNEIDASRSIYLSGVLSFAVAQFNSVKVKLNAPHHQKIKAIFAKQQVYEEDIKKLSEFSNAYLYKMLEDLYRNADVFISAPMRTISESPYYADIYHRDDIYDIKFLEKCISVVRQNKMFINFFEIGTGTGGFLKQVGAYLHPLDVVNCSDITVERIIHDEITKDLNVNYYSFDLNNELSAETKELIHQADVIVSSNALHACRDLKYNLQRLYAEMKPGAFMLLLEITSALTLALFGMDEAAWDFTDERDYGLWLSIKRWIDLFKASNFKLISYLSDKREVITTFFLRKPFNEVYTMLPAPTVNYNHAWAKQIKNTAGPFLLYAQELTGMAGFARAISRENKRTICLCATDPHRYIKEIKQYDLVTNVVRNDVLHTICFVTESKNKLQSPKDIDQYHLEFNEIGNFDNFKFVINKPRPGQLCKVEYAALNFRDVMLASGKINRDTNLGHSRHGSGVGFEFSGLCNGKKVMGVALDTIANYVRTNLLWEVPDDMELAGAATITAVYMTVYYSFFERAKIQKHHRVLIHGGSGAVGQAAIRVAQDVGCEIFTTCQQAKRDYVKKLFPNLDDAHIADSRSTQFEQQIMEQTQGYGVDVVLNSLADDKLQAGLRCLAQHGVFIEIGKYDMMLNTSLGMKFLLRNTTLCGVDVDQVFDEPSIVAKLSILMADGLRRGVVRPIDHKIFNWRETPEAFRFLGSGKHLGKVLLDMRDLKPEIVERRFFTSGAHLIVGGLGGFGMALAEWLAERGANHLILVSRNGVSNGEQRLFLERLSKFNIKVDIVQKNLVSLHETKVLLEQLPPLTGIYHLALILHDVFFEDMTKEQWEETVKCKVEIARNLDQLTRHKNIQHFVCFSSISSQGNPKQSNYAYANNYLESICNARREASYPATAIQWGAVGNVGFVAKHDKKLVETLGKSLGTALQSIQSCLDYLESCLLLNETTYLVSRPYQYTREINFKVDKVNIMEKIGQILRMDLEKVPMQSNLTSLGMDSLQSAEIQSAISLATQQLVPIPVLSKMTIAELKEKFAKDIDKELPKKFQANSESLQSENKKIHLQQTSNQKVTETEKMYPITITQEKCLAAKWPNIISVPCLVTGKIDAQLFEECVNDIVKRHDSLRSIFVKINGRYMRKVLPNLNFKLHRIAMPDLLRGDWRTKLKNITRETIKSIQPSSNGTMLAIWFIKVSETSHVIITSFDHLIGDGWSARIFFEELVTSYHTRILGMEPPLPELKSTHGDFVVWQQEKIAKINQEKFTTWKSKIKNIQKLPIIKPNHLDNEASGKLYKRHIQLSKKTTALIKDASKKMGANIFTTLVAAYQTFIYSLTNQKDVAIRSNYACREKKEWKNVMGFFATNLILASTLSEQATFKDTVKMIEKNILESLKFGFIPFAHIENEIKNEGMDTRNLIPLEFNFFPFSMEPIVIGDVKYEILTSSPIIHRLGFAVQMLCYVINDSMLITLLYRSNVHEEFIQKFSLASFAKFIKKLFSQHDVPLKNILGVEVGSARSAGEIL